MKPSDKKDEGIKKKDERKSAIEILTPLVGLKVSDMTKAEQENLLIAMGQLLGLLNDKGKVKPL